MAYTVFGYSQSTTVMDASRTMEATRVALQRAIAQDGRFGATLTPITFAPRTRHLPQGYSLTIQYVRLKKAKEYCGQHPGVCIVDPRFPHKKANYKYLEWDDWVAFHGLVNDVLDRLEVTADAWTNPRELLSTGSKMWIRRHNKRRVRFDWDEKFIGGLRGPARVWNAGTPDQFAAADSVTKRMVAGGRLA